MRYRVVATFLFLLASIWAAPCKAQWWGAEKWEVAPFVGYETGGTFPVNNSLTTSQFRVNSGMSFGSYVDYSVTENFQAEFMWDRTNTSFSAQNALTGLYTKAFDSDIDQFELGALYMFRNSEAKVRPFAAGGIGVTHEYNGGSNTNHTLLSFGLGGGVKYRLSRHFSLRGDARWLPTRANSTPGTVCGYYGYCYPGYTSNYLQRFNLTAGVAIHF